MSLGIDFEPALHIEEFRAKWALGAVESVQASVAGKDVQADGR